MWRRSSAPTRSSRASRFPTGASSRASAWPSSDSAGASTACPSSARPARRRRFLVERRRRGEARARRARRHPRRPQRRAEVRRLDHSPSRLTSGVDPRFGCCPAAGQRTRDKPRKPPTLNARHFGTLVGLCRRMYDSTLVPPHSDDTFPHQTYPPWRSLMRVLGLLAGVLAAQEAPALPAFEVRLFQAARQIVALRSRRPAADDVAPAPLRRRRLPRAGQRRARRVARRRTDHRRRSTRAR